MMKYDPVANFAQQSIFYCLSKYTVKLFYYVYIYTVSVDLRVNRIDAL